MVTRKFIEQELAHTPNIGKKHIAIPAAQREQIVFYRTDDPSVWEAEVQTAAESQVVSYSVGAVDEVLLNRQHGKTHRLKSFCVRRSSRCGVLTGRSEKT